MANVRIKDITTTASAPAADDYLAIDGATAGTRKIKPSDLNKGDGLTEDIKQAMLQIAEKVAYVDASGSTYYQNLYDALYPPIGLSSISAVYTQSGTVYDTDDLNSLKADLVVTATYDDSSTAVIPDTDYSLSGNLTTGTSVITVMYEGKTASFNVTVTEHQEVSENLTLTSSASIDNTTWEDTSATNIWRFNAGTLKANKLRFTWDSTECNGFQVGIYQYDANDAPYQRSNTISYSSNPTTDGADITWTEPGALTWTALGGGLITVNLPTTGIVKVITRRSSGQGSAVTTNGEYGTWLNNGGLVVTAIQE